MSVVRLIFVLVIIFESIFAVDRGGSCVTPNNEQAKCIAVKQCDIIRQAISTQNSSAIEFAKKSQCGYDTEPLVCCGTSAYFLPTTTEFDYGNIFTTPTPKPSTQPPVRQDVILQNFETKALPDRTVCGLEKEAERVYGGMVTQLDEFPWMAALEYMSTFTKENAGIRCGGSIINNRYVITAAHCIINQEFVIISVWLGEWKISTDPDCQTLIANTECADDVKKIKVRDQISHPYYSKRSGNNDIGLLRLAEDVKFTDYIRPICLPPANLPNPELRTPMTVSGWGATENGTNSDFKLKVDVPLLANVDCNRKLSKPVTPNQLCAGGEEGKDACKGDSGGPLMRTYQDALSAQPQWYLEGVVSLGVGCGRLDQPALYTRVSRYISWIINIISADN